MRILTFIQCLLLMFVAGSVSAAETTRIHSEKHDFQLQLISDGLQHPWDMVFLPGGDILVSERTGHLRRIQQGRLLAEPIKGLPEIAVEGQGGLMGLALDPDFEQNQWLYFSYAGRGPGGIGTEVARARLEGMQLKDLQVLFRALPKSGGGHHFGGRLLFDDQHNLYLSLGDRGDKDRAQDLNDHAGSLIRIRADGSIPADNPFANENLGRAEIFTRGNRNMQGMALNPDTREVWTHEHGPQGGDEVNIMRAGENYGWPVITYGVNYVIGTRIGEGTSKTGMRQPIHYWVPSIAPSGMAFYQGSEFPAWQGNLFIGSLKFGLLVRLEISQDQVIHEERLLEGRFGRIRAVRQGLDGSLYLLTDEDSGNLFRLQRVDRPGD